MYIYVKYNMYINIYIYVIYIRYIYIVYRFMTPCTCMWTGCGGTVQQNTPRQNWCSHQTHTLNPSSSLYNLKIANLYHFYVCGVNTSKRPCACGYVCWVWGWGGVVGMLTVIATATTQYVLLHFHT